ncbi:antitoxin [Deinococcus aestuarii]|uniref:antitoxin n=1 Tax=Deinococcus aestuarii TaxID=2774531 RepID=UPI001C0BEBF4|nr:type II toxin-antitoxin system VapB family antitoxin [Deinococcus aestuarii]
MTRAKYDTAKLFQTGRSQAVRLPKEYRFEGEEVIIKRVGDGVLLLPQNNGWKNLLASLEKFDGFQIERDQGEQQERDWGDL